MNYPPAHFLDSVQVPTPEQAAKLYAQGYYGWAANVYGDGVPASELWTPADVRTVTDAGFQFLPIATVDWSLNQSAEELAYGAVCAAIRAGVVGVVALDTEYQERGNPKLTLTVDGFVRRVRAMHWTPVIYAGAAYYGTGVQWIPRWTAPSGSVGPVPTAPLGTAVQYAGGVSLEGVLVDLSVNAGVEFGETLPAVDVL
jgi:hypothetical protein